MEDVVVASVEEGDSAVSFAEGFSDFETSKAAADDHDMGSGGLGLGKVVGRSESIRHVGILVWVSDERSGLYAAWGRKCLSGIVRLREGKRQSNWMVRMFRGRLTGST